MSGTNKKYRTAMATTFVAIAVLSVSLLCSCKKEIEKLGALYSCDEYTVYPDSLSSDGFTISAAGDSMYIRGNGELQVAPIDCRNSAGMKMSGSDTLINYLFNRPTASISKHYDALTSFDIYAADGLLDADSASVCVDSRIAGETIKECGDGLFRWPVAMSDATWWLAAATVSSMRNDSRSEATRAAVLKNLVDRDIEYVYDSHESFFTGVPCDMSGKELPSWANAGDASVMMTLSGNISRLAAMRYINKIMPGSYDSNFIGELQSGIATRFWIPNLSILSQTLYQRPCPISVTAADNIAQSFAIVTSGVSGEMAKRIVSHTPVSGNHIPPSYPDQGINDRRRTTLTCAMWAIASSRVANDNAFALSFSALADRCYDDNYAGRLMQGVILRTIFGLDPQPDGLVLSPYVHPALGDIHTLEGFRYGDSKLNITVRGNGNEISTITVDGNVVSGNVIKRDIKGTHNIDIVLSPPAIDPQPSTINITDIPAAPAPPEVERIAVRNYDINSPSTGNFLVYLNGAINELISRNHYELYSAAPLTAICFEADVSNQVTGYASKNMLYIPPSDSISIPCTSVARTGGRVLAKKDLAAKFVESTRYKNKTLKFEYESALGGSYYIRLRYLDGLGIVNNSRRYALRLLNVNGRREGIMVLAQRSPQMWSPDEDWAAMRGVTEPIEVTFIAGTNIIEVEYFAPGSDDSFDHDSNTVIPVALEIIRIER